MKHTQFYEVTIQGLCRGSGQALRWVDYVEVQGGDIVVHTCPEQRLVSHELACVFSRVLACAANRPSYVICCSQHDVYEEDSHD